MLFPRTKLLKSNSNTNKQKQINYKMTKTLSVRTKILKSKSDASKHKVNNYKMV